MRSFVHVKNQHAADANTWFYFSSHSSEKCWWLLLVFLSGLVHFFFVNKWLRSEVLWQQFFSLYLCSTFFLFPTRAFSFQFVPKCKLLFLSRADSLHPPFHFLLFLVICLRILILFGLLRQPWLYDGAPKHPKSSEWAEK